MVHYGRASMAANSAMVADVPSSFLLTTRQSRRLKQHRKFIKSVNKGQGPPQPNSHPRARLHLSKVAQPT